MPFHIFVPSYTLQITCQDGGRPPLSSSVALVVGVVDENDNRPSFDRVRHDIKIFENSRPEATVLRLRATDPDQGLNSVIKYSLIREEKFPSNLSASQVDVKGQPRTNETENHFRVDARTGELKNSIPLDREKVKAYIVVVGAEDSGNPPLTSATQIFIEVADENDERPKLLPGSEILSVPENTKPPTVIGAVKFWDADLPPYNRFTVRLLGEAVHHDYDRQQLLLQLQQNKLLLHQQYQHFSIWQNAFRPAHPLFTNQNQGTKVEPLQGHLGEASNGIFSVDPKTGDVTVHAMLDREEKATHLLSVVAIDDHNPQLITTATVTVHVSFGDFQLTVSTMTLKTSYRM